MSKSKEELAKMHWRERYSYEAQRADESLSKLTEQELVNRVQRNQIGQYFSIWRIIGQKGTVSISALALWEYLQRSNGGANMLHRYHCAATLFKILGLDDPACENDLRKQVQWDFNGEEARQEALLRLKRIIEELEVSSANE